MLSGEASPCPVSACEVASPIGELSVTLAAPLVLHDFGRPTGGGQGQCGVSRPALLRVRVLHHLPVRPLVTRPFSLEARVSSPLLA